MAHAHCDTYAQVPTVDAHDGEIFIRLGNRPDGFRLALDFDEARKLIADVQEALDRAEREAEVAA